MFELAGLIPGRREKHSSIRATRQKIVELTTNHLEFLHQKRGGNLDAPFAESHHLFLGICKDYNPEQGEQSVGRWLGHPHESVKETIEGALAVMEPVIGRFGFCKTPEQLRYLLALIPEDQRNYPVKHIPDSAHQLYERQHERRDKSAIPTYLVDLKGGLTLGFYHGDAAVGCYVRYTDKEYDPNLNQLMGEEIRELSKNPSDNRVRSKAVQVWSNLFPGNTYDDLHMRRQFLCFGSDGSRVAHNKRESQIKMVRRDGFLYVYDSGLDLRIRKNEKGSKVRLPNATDGLKAIIPLGESIRVSFGSVKDWEVGNNVQDFSSWPQKDKLSIISSI